MLFFVFFIEFDLYMTLILPWNDLCTPPQYSGTPTRVPISTQSYENLQQFKAYFHTTIFGHFWHSILVLAKGELHSEFIRK